MQYGENVYVYVRQFPLHEAHANDHLRRARQNQFLICGLLPVLPSCFGAERMPTRDSQLAMATPRL